jgi:hypothetical protein
MIYDTASFLFKIPANSAQTALTSTRTAVCCNTIFTTKKIE